MAALVLDFPTSLQSKRICLWRLDFSTISSSTTAIRPTPAATKYFNAGDPNPPAPTTRTFASLSFFGQIHQTPRGKDAADSVRSRLGRNQSFSN